MPIIVKAYSEACQTPSPCVKLEVVVVEGTPGTPGTFKDCSFRDTEPLGGTVVKRGSTVKILVRCEPSSSSQQ